MNPPTSLPPASFDYSSLPPDLAERLRGTADAVRTTFTRALNDMAAIGTLLLQSKAEMKHGDFGRWLKAEFSESERTLQNCMRLAEISGGKSAMFAGLPITVAYAISAPSTPTEARSEILAIRDSSKRVTIGDARKIIASAKMRATDIEPLPRSSDELAGEVISATGASEREYMAKRLADELRRLAGDTLEELRPYIEDPNVWSSARELLVGSDAPTPVPP